MLFRTRRGDAARAPHEGTRVTDVEPGRPAASRVTARHATGPRSVLAPALRPGRLRPRHVHGRPARPRNATSRTTPPRSTRISAASSARTRRARRLHQRAPGRGRLVLDDPAAGRRDERRLRRQSRRVQAPARADAGILRRAAARQPDGARAHGRRRAARRRHRAPAITPIARDGVGRSLADDRRRLRASSIRCFPAACCWR